MLALLEITHGEQADETRDFFFFLFSHHELGNLKVVASICSTPSLV